MIERVFLACISTAVLFCLFWPKPATQHIHKSIPFTSIVLVYGASGTSANVFEVVVVVLNWKPYCFLIPRKET